jgi:hypothetical protein
MIEKSDMNNIDWTSWEKRNHKNHLNQSQEWKNATSKKMQNKIFQDYGVWWSEMMHLPYWDPTQHVVVDGMHNLFLGLVQFHCCVVLGISTPVANPKGDDSYQEFKLARPLLSSNPTTNKLRKLKVSVLRRWCNNSGMITTGKSKNELIAAILSNTSDSNNRQPVQPPMPSDGSIEEIDPPDEDDGPDNHNLPCYTSNEISQKGYQDAHLSKDEISHL